jgi:hypothetical protein
MLAIPCAFVRTRGLPVGAVRVLSHGALERDGAGRFARPRAADEFRRARGRACLPGRSHPAQPVSSRASEWHGFGGRWKIPASPIV